MKIKLKEFIREVCKSWEGNPVEIDFDIGVEPDMTVNPDSPNRVRFSLVKI